MNNKIPPEVEGVRSSVYDSIRLDIIERYGKQFYEDFVEMLKHKGFKAGQKQNLDFTDGFREGRLYEREKVLKLIENLRLKYKGNSFISLIDEYSEELLSKIGDVQQSKEKRE